jgi:hypothetical protein
MEEDPDELCKSISTFCSLEQMMIFGRPLWMSYSIEDTLDIAQLKLLGGKESDLKYNPLVDSTICSFEANPMKMALFGVKMMIIKIIYLPDDLNPTRSSVMAKTARLLTTSP